MFDYFESKKTQKRYAKIATYLGAGVLTFAGIWGFVYLVKAANLETVKAIEYSGSITLYAILYLLALLGSAAASVMFLRNPKKQWAVRGWTSILFFWAAIFAFAAIKIPSESYKVHDELHN